MKKLFFMMLLAGALTFMAAGEGHARAPGCSPEMLERQQNFNEAARVRNKAYSQQVLKKNDSGSGTLCLDNKMLLSTILGNMFSEKVRDSDVYSGDFSNIFGMTGTNPSMGFGNGEILVQVLGNTVMPMVTNHVGNFGGTMSDLLGANVMNAWSTVNGYVNTAMGEVNGIMREVTDATNEVNRWMRLINTALGLITMIPMPGAVSALVDQVNNYWDDISGFINGTVRPLVRRLQQTIRNLMNQIMSQIRSILSGSGTRKCDYLRQLWRTGSVSVVGKGKTAGTPYFNINDMIRGTPINGAGQDMTRAISNDSAVLQRALRDLQNGSMPGQIPGWPATPNINSNMSIEQILRQIR